MCGIAGLITKNKAENPSMILYKMANEINHRGPDDCGFFETTSSNGKYFIGLGHKRLSIIDLAGGHQPMSNEAGTIQIVFNGEIYNFKDLRNDLIDKGHKFQTNSDTETIVHSYEEYGESCVEKFRGMFAFALWDADNEKLFLARDRFGKKPLFIYNSDNTLLFASEIKSLLASPEIPVEVNTDVISEYLLYRYVPAPSTLFKKIFKLMPGFYATWENNKLKEKNYYIPPDQKKLVGSIKIKNPIDDFFKNLDEAVRIRMVSDVPFGAFLSGGIDSSSIVALMTRHSILPIKTFSVAFEEEKYSEASYANLIAEKFKTDHHELVITSGHLMDELPGLIRFRDAPVSETADIPIYLLSKYARKRVKMVLTGEGSDEILGGYPKHVFERYVNMYQIIPKFIHNNFIVPLISRLPYGFRRAKTAIANLGLKDTVERLPRWFGSVTKEELKNLLIFNSPEQRNNPGIHFNTDKKNSNLRKILYFDQTSWLPDNLLERGDRMTMAVSLEARMPFMDHKLAEFVSSLPDKYRVRRNQTKWILRKAMENIIPKRIIKRPKVGFRVPVNEWFQTSMKDYLYDHLTGPNSMTKNYFRPNSIEKILEEHVKKQQNHEKMLWCLLNLELWHKHYKSGLYN